MWALFNFNLLFHAQWLDNLTYYWCGSDQEQPGSRDAQKTAVVAMPECLARIER